MNPIGQERLIQFLKEDLAIPMGAIALALKQSKAMPNFLPMTLWHYGLITIDQLALIFDWIESA